MYWRQENYETLPKLSAEAKQRGYPEFAEYCLLREKGRRRDALPKLTSFIKMMESEPTVKQREFADWLLTFCFHNPCVYDACPMPLKRDFIAPTIDSWTRDEPENPRALRWHEDERALLVAARSFPADEIAIGRYCSVILQGIDYTTHELPHGYLGESLQADLADVQTALDLLNRVPTAVFFESYREEALLLKLKLQKQIEKNSRSR